MQKKILLTIILVIIFGIILYLKFFPKKEIHYHAGFKVYVEGKLEDFYQIKYMSVLACENDEEAEHEENEQLEKAHLHDKVGDVVHVEAEGAKWKDLFQNINYRFDKPKELTGFINGKKVENILNFPIKSYDSVIIFSGNVNEKLLPSAVSKERIKEVEKMAENC